MDAPTGGFSSGLDNRHIADALERVAELLELQEASTFRVRAYRLAAQSVRELEQPIGRLLQERGLAGLDGIPHVGPSIARAIAELSETGRLRMRERLEGELGPERLFASVPGIGPGLAHRIHERLQIDTLEELEVAAHDGRLDRVRGMGPRRVRAMRELLASLLRRRKYARVELERHASQRPSVEQLLAIDTEYRLLAARRALPLIAPRRFNRKHEAWLPVMHREVGEHHVTALYSNTALAHRLGTTHDWVIIFYEGAHGEGQCTVVTESTGELRGKRVVRGREHECAALYARQQTPNPAESN